MGKQCYTLNQIIYILHIGMRFRKYTFKHKIVSQFKNSSKSYFHFM